MPETTTTGRLFEKEMAEPSDIELCQLRVTHKLFSRKRDQRRDNLVIRSQVAAAVAIHQYLHVRVQSRSATHPGCMCNAPLTIKTSRSCSRSKRPAEAVIRSPGGTPSGSCYSGLGVGDLSDPLFAACCGSTLQRQPHDSSLMTNSAALRSQ